MSLHVNYSVELKAQVALALDGLEEDEEGTQVVGGSHDLRTQTPQLASIDAHIAVQRARVLACFCTTFTLTVARARRNTHIQLHTYMTSSCDHAHSMLIVKRGPWGNSISAPRERFPFGETYILAQRLFRTP